MHTPQIAFCSPVNPAPSGIADYSEELLPYLGQYARITLFVEDGLRPSNPQLARHLEVLPLRRLPRELRRRRYDGIVYHIGNSPAHAGIWRAAQRMPGVVVLHDFVLHHFMLWYAANVQHDVQRYVRMMEAQYGEPGGHMARLMIRSRFTDAAFDFPCCEPAVAAARGLIAHSRYVADQVSALRPELPTAVVPMGVPVRPIADRAAARARLGLPSSTAVLASFGHINAWKRVEPALRALAALREEGRDVRYILVGSVSPNYHLAGVIERMGLGGAVTVTGYVPRAQFEDYVAAADICVNLRYPSGGETSASLLRLLGAGRPTLVSHTGSFAELPPGVAAQVDPDAAEGALILAYCRLLLDRPDLADSLGAAARRFVAAEHTLEGAALGYARFLARLYGWPALRRVAEAPLWELDAGQGDGGAGDTYGRIAMRPNGTRGQGKFEEQIPLSPPPLGPLSPAPPAPPPIIAALGRAAAEIGLTERDEGPLRAAAERAREIGLV